MCQTRPPFNFAHVNKKGSIAEYISMTYIYIDESLHSSIKPSVYGIYFVSGRSGCYQDASTPSSCTPGLILGLRPANKKRRYKVTPSLFG